MNALTAVATDARQNDPGESRGPCQPVEAHVERGQQPVVRVVLGVEQGLRPKHDRQANGRAEHPSQHHLPL